MPIRVEEGGAMGKIIPFSTKVSEFVTLDEYAPDFAGQVLTAISGKPADTAVLVEGLGKLMYLAEIAVECKNAKICQILIELGVLEAGK